MATVTPPVTLRAMAPGDLPAVRQWLTEPHVARWWADDVDKQMAEFVQAIEGREPTQLLVVQAGGRPVGWCQWYRWGDYPEDAPDYGASDDEIGLDYAIGEVADISRGLGTEMIAAVVAHVRRRRPETPILVAVSTLNRASRRVLEKNGFVLVDERVIESEPGEEPTALYRLMGDLGRA